MGRLELKEKRAIEEEELYLGKILIICEGYTEKNYIKYIADRIKEKSKLSKNEMKYNEIVFVNIEKFLAPKEGNNIDSILAGGDANRVLSVADEVVQKNPQYMNYDKYLVFDCDAPSPIQKTIKNMLESLNEYKLALSNVMFETWLLMHFEEVSTKYTKSVLYQKLASNLGLKAGVKYADLKADKDMIDSLFKLGDVNKAIKNGKDLYEEYKKKNLTISENIDDMNPHVPIYELIELLLKYI